mmetsp:Transcript_26503/g.64014  ORF Transcript_26503/g.64014 Transcript_26503/m.64014 type:complete len:225 (+) Transcript_26503:1034-1708(+)
MSGPYIACPSTVCPQRSNGHHRWRVRVAVRSSPPIPFRSAGSSPFPRRRRRQQATPILDDASPPAVLHGLPQSHREGSAAGVSEEGGGKNRRRDSRGHGDQGGARRGWGCSALPAGPAWSRPALVPLLFFPPLPQMRRQRLRKRMGRSGLRWWKWKWRRRRRRWRRKGRGAPKGGRWRAGSPRAFWWGPYSPRAPPSSSPSPSPPSPSPAEGQPVGRSHGGVAR